jgi:hypothetical protein
MGRGRGNGGRGWFGRVVVVVVVLVAVASSYVGGFGGALPGRGPFSDMLRLRVLERAGVLCWSSVLKVVNLYFLG